MYKSSHRITCATCFLAQWCDKRPSHNLDKHEDCPYSVRAESPVEVRELQKRKLKKGDM